MPTVYKDVLADFPALDNAKRFTEDKLKEKYPAEHQIHQALLF
jgi:hypothetical protein